MSSHWFSIVSLVAALLIGYSLLNNRDDNDLDRSHEQTTLLGYYLKDAVITETSESGAPKLRLAASDVVQNIKDDSLSLSAVRADYVWTAKTRNASGASGGSNLGNNPSTSPGINHWVLNADQALVPAATQHVALIELRGNVEAHSVNAPHNTTINTESLDIDTRKQLAHSADFVQVDIDGHTANGRELLVDMDKNRVQLKSNVTLRLAATKPEARGQAHKEPPISLPDLFESDSLDVVDNIVILKNVRSKSEPFISAHQLRATGTDLANNHVVMTGAVSLELPKRGLVTADVATLAIRDNRIVHAQLTGKPVNFQHQRKDSDQLVRGRGTTIDYEVATQLLQFSGDTWFSDGKIEATSKFFEYNLATEAAHGDHPLITIHATPGKDDTAATEPVPEPKSAEAKQ